MVMGRRFNHFTLRYLKDRLVLALQEQRRPDDPWLTADAIRLLDQLLKPGDVGVEFGSGRSTSWSSSRISHLTSVEHSETWFAKVQARLVEQGLTDKVDYRRCDPEEYAAQPYSFADGSIDYCLIDGIERDRCALRMVPKMRSGGLLVIDNVNWCLPNDETQSPQSLRMDGGTASPVWDEFTALVSDWRRIWTSNGIWDTTIWFAG